MLASLNQWWVPESVRDSASKDKLKKIFFEDAMPVSDFHICTHTETDRHLDTHIYTKIFIQKHLYAYIHTHLYTRRKRKRERTLSQSPFTDEALSG